MWDHLPADAISHVASHLECTPDRQSARSVCKAWRSALDLHWTAGCFLARLHDNPTDKAARLLPRFRALQRPLWPRLRRLDLVELNAQRAALLLQELIPSSFPQLAALGLSTALHEPCAEGGKLGRLQLPLRELRLSDVRVKEGLRALTHLRQLSALHVSSTSHGGGGGWELGDPQCLTTFEQLQALSLPALDQAARAVLPLLTRLTALKFGAAGSGAVGANLLPLAPALRSLCIELHHKREHFLVLHPAVEWTALAQLSSLTRLEVANWAAGRHNAAPLLSAPVYIWTDQSTAQEHADAVLAGCPALRCLRITAAYCRLDRHGPAGVGGSGGGRGGSSAPERVPSGVVGAAAASQAAEWQSSGARGGDGEGEAVVSDARGRWWVRRERRVPVYRPGNKREEGWYHAWWQADLQRALTEMFGEEDPSVLRYRAEAFNVQGWVAIRNDSPNTYDLQLDYRLA